MCIRDRFLPDYASEEDAPLRVVRAETLSGSARLSHRDYLGSLTGLGIKREMIGDILIHETGADILVLEEMAEFLLLHYCLLYTSSSRLAPSAAEISLHLPSQSCRCQ